MDWKYPYIGLKTLCRLNVGDKVRTLIEKKEFEKGYLRNWSDQVYIITKKLQQYGVCWYYLSELNGNSVKGIWYYYQLNLIAKYADTSLHYKRSQL